MERCTDGVVEQAAEGASFWEDVNGDVHYRKNRSPNVMERRCLLPACARAPRIGTVCMCVCHEHISTQGPASTGVSRRGKPSAVRAQSWGAGLSPAPHQLGYCKAAAASAHPAAHLAAGIGEIGKEAYAFIDFLEAAHMQIWQVLPLVPPGRPIPGVREDYWSPYSGQDASAGFPLLIELQVRQSNSWHWELCMGECGEIGKRSSAGEWW
jgi:hypothetical protein